MAAQGESNPKLGGSGLRVAAALACLALVGCGDGGGPSSAEKPEPSGFRNRVELRLVNVIRPAAPRLRGVAVGKDGHVYVAGARGVARLAPDGKTLRTWPTGEPAVAVALAPDGAVFAAHATRIEKYDKDGKLLKRWGRKGRGRGEFGFITDMAASEWRLYIADAGNRRVAQFDVTGDFINEIGRRDEAAGIPGLLVPSPCLGCAVNRKGELLVGNPGRHRVERYASDGRLLGAWGKYGVGPEGFCGCCNPIDVAVDGKARVVTVEKGRPRVKVHDPSGRLLAVMDKDLVRRALEHASPPLIAPEDIGRALEGRCFGAVAAGPGGRLYVVNPENNTLWVFEESKTAAGRDLTAPTREQRAGGN